MRDFLSYKFKREITGSKGLTTFLLGSVSLHCKKVMPIFLSISRFLRLHLYESLTILAFFKVIRYVKSGLSLLFSFSVP